jgi:hypothetical protein
VQNLIPRNIYKIFFLVFWAISAVNGFKVCYKCYNDPKHFFGKIMEKNKMNTGFHADFKTVVKLVIEHQKDITKSDGNNKGNGKNTVHSIQLLLQFVYSF